MMANRYPHAKWDPRFSCGEADSIRTQLDNERAVRDRRAAALERKIFEATTRDLAPAKPTPRPVALAVDLPPASFTPAELEEF